MRGKEAAAAARRRVEELEAQVAALREQHAHQSKDAVLREQELRADRDRLAGVLARDVEAMSAERVAGVEARYEQQGVAAVDAAKRRTDAIARVLRRPTVSMSPEDWAELSALLGVYLSMPPDASREERRIRPTEHAGLVSRVGQLQGRKGVSMEFHLDAGERAELKREKQQDRQPDPLT